MTADTPTVDSVYAEIRGDDEQWNEMIRDRISDVFDSMRDDIHEHIEDVVDEATIQA
jgi:hypothetical protein